LRDRVTITGCLLIALVAITAACGGTTSSPGSQTKVSVSPPTSLLKSGELSDCVDIEYSPMEYFASAGVTDPNQAVGFDVEGARAVAKAFGLTLNVRNTGFDALIPDLTAGRCDIVLDRTFHLAEAAGRGRCGALHGNRPRDHGHQGQPEEHQIA